MTTSKTLFKSVNIFQQFLLLLGFMLLGLFISSELSASLGTDLTRSKVLITSVFQNIFAFILPAVILPLMSRRKVGEWLHLGAGKGTAISYLGILVMFIVALPAMHALIDANEAITFPASMSELEHTLRTWEDMGARSSQLILESDSIWSMLVTVGAVGILTGLGEEFFFRGGIQNILTRNGIGPVTSILVTAAIFSAAHFQFFGFIPRMALGAWFGWLYWRYGSIWPAVTAHAINNSVVVIASMGIEQGWLPADFEMFGVPVNMYTPVIIASLVMMTVTFRLFFSRRS